MRINEEGSNGEEPTQESQRPHEVNLISKDSDDDVAYESVRGECHGTFCKKQGRLL